MTMFKNECLGNTSDFTVLALLGDFSELLTLLNNFYRFIPTGGSSNLTQHLLKKKQTIKKHFIDQTSKLYDFVLKADNMLDKMTEFNDNWLGKLVLKIMK